jgi:hypothetical protein
MPDLGPIQPRHPIYIPSKGRADYPITIRALSRYRIPFNVIVEAPEQEAYEAVVKHHGGYGTVLVLDPAYQRDYDACMDLTPEQSRGSGPARNYGWEHAKAAGATRYWCMDDNIAGFWYYNHNRKMNAGDALPIRLMEDFTERYVNVAMSGPNYYMFIPRKRYFPPAFFNTRIYSCNLIQTDLPFRWRGRYNEDSILSLDLLKAGFCTVQFNAWLQWKTPTGVLPGGNQTEIYADGTLEKSRMLVREHPDVTRLMWRFGRHHHFIDYRPFKDQRLILRDDAEPLRYPGTTARTRATLPPLRPEPS